jgi:hypothetical protein
MQVGYFTPHYSSPLRPLLLLHKICCAGSLPRPSRLFVDDETYPLLCARGTRTAPRRTVRMASTDAALAHIWLLFVDLFLRFSPSFDFIGSNQHRL